MRIQPSLRDRFFISWKHNVLFSIYRVHTSCTRELLKIATSVQTNEPRHEKTSIKVSDLVRHKPGCTAKEDGKRLEISDLESRGSILYMQRKQRR